MKDGDPLQDSDGLGFYEPLCEADDMQQKYRFPEDLEDWMDSLKGKGTLKSPYHCEVLSSIENATCDDIGWRALAGVFFTDSRGMLYQYVNKPSWQMDVPGRNVLNMISVNGKRCGRVIRYENTKLWDHLDIPQGFREFVEKTPDEEIHRMVSYEEYAELERGIGRSSAPSPASCHGVIPSGPAQGPLTQNHPQEPGMKIRSKTEDFFADLIGGGFLLAVYVLLPIAWTVYCLINYGLFSWATWFWPGMIALGWLACKLRDW